MGQTYRKLTAVEIKSLEANGCSTVEPTWDLVEVAETGFTPEHVKQVCFSSHVRIGANDGTFTVSSGLKRAAGIYNSTIHNCVIGDQVFVSNVKNYVANYCLESQVIIENIEVLATEGRSSFGNGTQVAVLNETGGREVVIFDRLSAQLAYVLALYRHRPQAIQQINNLIEAYVKSISSEYGTIGKGTMITNSGTIKNIRTGAFAQIEGAWILREGTVNSTHEAPSYIGRGVVAEHFIVSTSTQVSDGAIIDKCFVGQGCDLGKQYSAENCLFFANCLGMHGEACAVFAGPYTVTHHKSTLLIAGLFSFLNAGSGSNQSNHMYKLGPIHQGIVERGSKTTSDSYLLWPAKIGVFTLVMGRHYKNSDTSDLPFSYLIEDNNESVLVPGANLRSVGTVRDAKKWPKRDKRRGNDILDQVNFNLLSPYTIQKMLNGREILRTLQHTSGPTSEYYSYQSCRIKNSSLHKGIQFYTMAINKFLGNSLIKRLEERSYDSDTAIRARLQPDTDVGQGEWIDMAGLIVPKSEVRKLLDGIENGTILSLAEIHTAFVKMHRNYYTYEWTWACAEICKKLKKSLAEITADDIREVVECWKKSVVDLDWLLYEDAKKEFQLSTKTGFGVDGNNLEKQIDFEQVRGDFEKNSFVTEVLEHIRIKSELGDDLIARIEHLA